MPDLVLATRNKGKIAEVQRLISLHAPQITLRSVSEFNLDDVEETGTTFEENALLKAETIARQTGLTALADDSGIAIDALDGAPGVYSARWSGVHGDDAANVAKVLLELSDVPDEDRGAQFVCVIALAHPDGRSIIVRGEVEGVVRRDPIGNHGFGYDPIFQPDGYAITTAQMDPETKDAISHRGKALREIASKIGPFIGA
ncbi:MAG: XTP/dITP diphosphatase [Candidatus Nanopelagicaceae bacterium]|jgi:XTP/dITP diphosphohydrolase|nr:XTP/dITP diphosphatase [Candidatus Nanopelagicaceae bacterium]